MKRTDDEVFFSIDFGGERSAAGSGATSDDDGVNLGIVAAALAGVLAVIAIGSC